jgi:hypothetical protein
MTNSFLDIQNKAFNIFIIISYTLLIALMLGVSKNAPQYLNKIDQYVKIYISLFLLYRFNPLWGTTKFTDLDRKIAFSSGVFIFTTTAINAALVNYLKYTKNVFTEQVDTLIN